jgi:demethoxyubiquinone hydroxylase (CLK1/Coq7/Cat5 family)|tara:strand:- start:143 stop:349 length:207 start_codon:yes stop_codon:yes gene_type:complete
MKNKKDTQQLATLVYIHAMRKEIEEEVKSKYSKRIEYLVNANNELMKELEQCESEIVTVEKECYGRGV